MSYATLMVYVEVDGHPKSRVSLATALSEKFKAMGEQLYLDADKDWAERARNPTTFFGRDIQQ